jgi:hypothetical protein
MTLVDRVRNICVSPSTEWPVIEQENTPAADLITSYLLPLAAVGAVAGVIGSSLIGTTVPFVGTYRAPFIGSLIGACIGIVFTVIGCFVIGFIINALAPTFSGRQDTNQALKTAVYCYTPVLVAGVARILPILGGLVQFVAAIYSLYILYLGLPVMMKSPRDKAPGYTVVVVICAIIVGVMISGVMLVLAGLGIAGARMF